MSSPEIEGPAFFSVREGMSCIVGMVFGILLVLIDRSAMRPARVWLTETCRVACFRSACVSIQDIPSLLECLCRTEEVYSQRQRSAK